MLSFRENKSQLNALGLAIMLSKNPKESDTNLQLQDIFLDQSIEESGFFFHNQKKKENESHQDCGCALSRLIGHHHKSY